MAAPITPPTHPTTQQAFIILLPLNIQPVVVVRGLERQQASALTNFVGCFLLALSFLFSLLLLSALNDLAGPSTGPLARITCSIPFHSIP